MPQNEKSQDRIYLGDGVYASHDGFQIWLAVNNHLNDVIALEPNVMEILIRYYERVKPIIKPV